MRNTIAYVDGYNLYCGLVDRRHYLPGKILKDPFRKYSWLNLESLISSYLPIDFLLIKIKYFTAMVKGDQVRAGRQEEYLKALKSIKILDPPYFGNIRRSGGKYSEKKTDIEMALHMYDDALNHDKYCLLLLSGDADQVPTIQWIRNLKKDIQLHVLFPPFRTPKEVKNLADGSYIIRKRNLAKHQFPDIVHYEEGGMKLKAYRPSLWK